MNNIITTNRLSFNYGGGSSFSLKPANIEIEEGSFVSVIGRNGSGKSTLVKLLAGLYENYEGIILFANSDVRAVGRKKLARQLAYLPQSVSIVNDSINVKELVILGRYPYKSIGEFGNNSEDAAIAEESLKRLGIEELSGKVFGELSGGQKQKVLLALTLAQIDVTGDLAGKVLIVDEPLTFLDVNNQYEIFSLLQKLNEEGLTIISVIHDLNIALRFTKKCLLMDNGEVVRSDDTTSVITEEMLKEHFMIESRITEYEKNYFINYLP